MTDHQKQREEIAHEFSEGLLHIGSGVVKWRLNQALEKLDQLRQSEIEKEREEWRKLNREADDTIVKLGRELSRTKEELARVKRLLPECTCEPDWVHPNCPVHSNR